MAAAMDSIQDMIDVNTIIGDPIETSNNVVIIPISKVSFGFAAGGSEFSEETIDEYTRKDKDEEEIKLLPVNHSSTIDRLLDYVPDLFEKIGKKMNKNNIIKNEIDEIIKKEETHKEEEKAKKKDEEEYEVEYQEDELDD